MIGVSATDPVVTLSDPCVEASAAGTIATSIVPPVVGAVDPSSETAAASVAGDGDVQEETGNQIQEDLFSGDDAVRNISQAIWSLKETHSSSSPRQRNHVAKKKKASTSIMRVEKEAFAACTIEGATPTSSET